MWEEVWQVSSCFKYNGLRQVSKSELYCSANAAESTHLVVGGNQDGSQLFSPHRQLAKALHDNPC